MRERAHIDAVLARYRTLPGQPTGRGGAAPKAQKLDEQEAAAAAEAVEGSGAASEDDGSASAAGYYPYKPYCTVCGTDFTTVTAYDDDTTALTYDCRCGHSETVLLSEFNGGKLVWKVDWPMRWTYEGVIFEPSGVDHQSPGSSWVVGGQLVQEVFGGTQPIGPMYAFVGIKGMAKMSSSRGGVPDPGRRAGDHGAGPGPLALRAPQAGPVLQRRLRRRGAPHVRRVGLPLPQGRRRHGAGPRTWRRTPAPRPPRPGALPTTPRPLPYRTLASVLDITTGHDEQTLRILSDLDPERPVELAGRAAPPADLRAALGRHPDARRRSAPTCAPSRTASCWSRWTTGPGSRCGCSPTGCDDRWSLDGLTALVYAVPKVQAGLPPEAKAATPELKAAQRQFFVLLYRLLIGKDTGPRLPTLLLAVGEERLRHLIGAA